MTSGQGGHRDEARTRHRHDDELGDPVPDLDGERLLGIGVQHGDANLAAVAGIRCAWAVDDRDAVLGEDLDLPQADSTGVSTGRVAQWVVGSFIPFRGLIREISGANSQERKIGTAIQAGIARRSFLKGVGQAKGCRYPARAATPQVVSARMDAIMAAKDAKATEAGSAGQ